LNLHIGGKPVEKSVDLARVAGATAGMSGADLRNIVNEAAILAARESRRTVTMADFNKAIERGVLGPERRSRVLDQKDKELTAYHEAGHAIVGKILQHTDPVHKISIVSHGMALGYTWSIPEDDKYLRSREEFEDELAQILAGRAAEQIQYNHISTGASNDLKQATKIAHEMVKVYGMSEKIGPVTLGEREELVFLGRELGEHKMYSEKVAELIDTEIRDIIKRAEKRAIETLKKYKTVMDKLVKILIKQETVEREEFDALF